MVHDAGTPEPMIDKPLIRIPSFHSGLFSLIQSRVKKSVQDTGGKTDALDLL